VEGNLTSALYTPKEAKVAAVRVMTKEEVEQHITVMDLREGLIDHLAIFVGMRPGEIFGLQRSHVGEDCRQITIEQRLYRGNIDSPKLRHSREFARFCSPKVTHPGGRAKERLARGNAVFWRAPNAIAG